MSTQHKRATWMCLISPAVRSEWHVPSLVFGLFESSASLFPSFLASVGLIYRARTPLPPLVYSSTCLSTHLSAGLLSVSFLCICLHLCCVSFAPGLTLTFLPTLFSTVFPLLNLPIFLLMARFLWKTLLPLSHPAALRLAEAPCTLALISHKFL